MNYENMKLERIFCCSEKFIPKQHTQLQNQPETHFHRQHNSQLLIISSLTQTFRISADNTHVFFILRAGDPFCYMMATRLEFGG